MQLLQTILCHMTHKYQGQRVCQLENACEWLHVVQDLHTAAMVSLALQNGECQW